MSREIKCPHCGAVIEDEWERFAYSEGIAEAQATCCTCDKDFTIARIVSVRYEVRALEAVSDGPWRAVCDSERDNVWHVCRIRGKGDPEFCTMEGTQNIWHMRDHQARELVARLNVNGEED